jgi:hypothetical protein
MKNQPVLLVMVISLSLAACKRNNELAANMPKETGAIPIVKTNTSLNASLSPYDNLVLADQPIAFWNDSALHDITGYSHNGAAMNNPATTALPNGDRSLVFNGITQYAEITDAPDLSVPASGILTLEAWLRPDVLDFPAMEGTGYVNWMGKGEPGQHEYTCRIYGQNPTGNDIGRGNRMAGNAYNLNGDAAAGSYYQPSAAAPLAAGEWLHYVFIINKAVTSTQYPNGYTKLYVSRKNSDGSLVSFKDQDALNVNALTGGAAPFRIGTRNLNSFFKGAIGKIAVYNYEPDSTHLLAHTKTMFGYDCLVLSGHPVAFWNTAGADLTANGHSGTLFNNPGITVLPNGDGSLLFNGTTQYVQVAGNDHLSVPATGILSLEAWIRPDVLTFETMDENNYVHWMGKRENGQCEYACRMYREAPVGNDSGRVNRISGYAFNLAGDKGAGSYYQAATGWRVQAGEWIHYVLTINTVNTSAQYPTGYTSLSIHRKNSSGAIITFQDKDALAGYSIIPHAGAAPFRIGTVDLGSFFHGSIGKPAVYDYELSAAKALEHAEKIFNP